MKYAKGVLITLLAKGFAIPVGVASSIITARYLGPEGRGVLAVLFVLQGAAVLFGSLGLHSSSTYFIARNKENASAIASNILSAALGLSLLTAGVLYAIGHIKPEALIGKVDVVYLNIFLIVVPFTYIAQFFQGMFLAYQKIYELNLLELFPRFLQMLLFAVVLMLLGLGTFEAVLCFVGAAVAGGVVYLLRARRLVPFTIQFHPPLFREMVAYGMRNYTASLLLFLVGRVNLILINYKLGTSEAGVYSVAMQIIDVVYIFPSTIALLLFPKISGNLQDTGALTAKVLRFSTAAMAGLCAGIVLLGRPFIEILFGPSFSDAVLPLLWLTPGVLSLALATIIINDLAGRGLPPVVLVASAIALLLNLVLVIPALETYGLVGSALATSAAHVVLLAILLVYYMKRMKVGARELLLVRFSDFTSIRFSE